MIARHDLRGHCCQPFDCYGLPPTAMIELVKHLVIARLVHPGLKTSGGLSEPAGFYSPLSELRADTHQWDEPIIVLQAQDTTNWESLNWPKHSLLKDCLQSKHSWKKNAPEPQLHRYFCMLPLAKQKIGCGLPRLSYCVGSHQLSDKIRTGRAPPCTSSKRCGLI